MVAVGCGRGSRGEPAEAANQTSAGATMPGDPPSGKGPVPRGPASSLRRPARIATRGSRMYGDGGLEAGLPAAGPRTLEVSYGITALWRIKYLRNACCVFSDILVPPASRSDSRGIRFNAPEALFVILVLLRSKYSRFRARCNVAMP